MSEIQELESRLRRLRDQEDERRRLASLRARGAFEDRTGIRYYEASDYAGLHTPDYAFYFGYEQTVPSPAGEEEWAFVASEAGGRELLRLPQSMVHPNEGESPSFYLAVGIGHFLSRDARRAGQEGGAK